MLQYNATMNKLKYTKQLTLSNFEYDVWDYSVKTISISVAPYFKYQQQALFAGLQSST